MANSPPSSVRSDPTGGPDADQEPNSSYTSLFDTSLEHHLPMQTTSIPPASSSIFIDAPEQDEPFDNLQGYSAPTLPVYINMGMNERADHVNFAGPIATTPDPPMSRSLAFIDIDYPILQSTQRRSHHQHHPHHTQNRNRYPYLQRPISTKALNGTQVPRTSLERLPLYEHRPAFRRSYFALRKPRIPQGRATKKEISIENILFLAPPMPKHLYPGYRHSRVATASAGSGGDDSQIAEDEEEEEEGNLQTSFRRWR